MILIAFAIILLVLVLTKNIAPVQALVVFLLALLIIALLGYADFGFHR